LAISQRHHYIPEFYIKGFVGNDGKVSVYNKELGRIDSIRKSPKQVFFEWNRNTYNVHGKETDFVEKVYQFGEDKFSPVYRKLTERLEQIDLTAKDLLHLILFIADTHWRLPTQDDEASTYVKSLTPENSLFKVRNKETGENVTEGLFDRIINEPSFIAGYRIVMAMKDYFEVEKDSSLNNWKIYYAPEQENRLHLLSDNPLIIKEKNGENILKSELVFPLSKSKIVYHTLGKVLKEIPAENRVATDILLFLQADKMVCGPDAKYLNAIANMASNYDTEWKVELLRNEIFNIFK
jgi:Protein of unknown function (DUF4238)